jgi:hypothetical protein
LCKQCRTEERRDRINPKFAPRDTPTALEIAYAAGFFEGEGSVGFHGRADRGSFRVTIGQKQAWPLELVQRFFGGSLAWREHRGFGIFVLEMNGRLAQDFIAAIEVWLSPRRLDQVETARARLRAREGGGASVALANTDPEVPGREHVSA